MEDFMKIAVYVRKSANLNYLRALSKWNTIEEYLVLKMVINKRNNWKSLYQSGIVIQRHINKKKIFTKKY